MKFKYIAQMLIIATLISSLAAPVTAMADEISEEEYGVIVNTAQVFKVSGGSAVIKKVVLGTIDLAENIAAEEISVKTASYTEEDLYILAHVICGEAQGYSTEEQLYVGSVVLNRVNSGSFPDTIKAVVFQKNQYACTWDGNYYREPTPQNWANAKHLLENGSVLPGNVVFQSGKKQGKGVYIKTSSHYYCYL